METIRTYTSDQVYAAQRLEKIDRDFLRIDRILKESSDETVILPSYGMSTLFFYEVDRQTLFGHWLIRRSLIRDLEESGAEEVARDIIDQNRRLVSFIFR